MVADVVVGSAMAWGVGGGCCGVWRSVGGSGLETEGRVWPPDLGILIESLKSISMT